MSEELNIERVQRDLEVLSEKLTRVNASLAALTATTTPGSIFVGDGVTVTRKNGTVYAGSNRSYVLWDGDTIEIDPKAFPVPICDQSGTFTIQPDSVVVFQCRYPDAFDLWLQKGTIRYESFQRSYRIMVALLKFFIRVRGGRTGAIGTKLTVSFNPDNQIADVCVSVPSAWVESLQSTDGSPNWKVPLDAANKGVQLVGDQVTEPAVIDC